MERLCDPMAQQTSTVWASSLEEAKSMAGPLLSIMSQMGGIAFGSQLGQALGRLSRDTRLPTSVYRWPKEGRCPAPSNRLPPDSSNRAARF